MTPEELVNKINEELSLKCDLYDGELTKMKLIIQQAKSEWCKEQRVNCLTAYKKKRSENLIKILKDEEITVSDGLMSVILNAPEP